MNILSTYSDRRPGAGRTPGQTGEGKALQHLASAIAGSCSLQAPPAMEEGS